MNPFDFFRKYRHFKANNQYSYPFLFFSVGAFKNLFQLIALAIGGWTIFQVAVGNWGVSVEKVIRESVAADAVSQRFSDIKTVEVPAVASDETAQVNTPIESGPHHTPPVIENGARQEFSWEWVMKQDENKFTIQFGSSPDKERLYQAANSFPGTEAVAVYPFKKTPSNRTVYGFSSGLYSNLENALLAIEGLPEDVRSLEPWIRPIDKLQKEIVVTLAK